MKASLSIKKSILALQHLIAMFGATVLVPILTGLDPSVALFSAGCGTLIFHYCTKKKVPVFLGSSFAFIPVIVQVAEQYGDLRYAQGGMLVAGLVYVLFSFFIRGIGIEKIQKILPPQVIGPMIIVIGFNLLPTAFNMAKTSYVVAGLTLAVAVAWPYLVKGFLKQISILVAVIFGYILSVALHLVDFTQINNAQYFAVPNFTLPLFNIEAIIIIVPIIFAVFMEHLGDITTNGAVVGQNFVEDPGLNRTLLGDGLATVFASLIGGPANTTYGENTGVLAITKNYDPSILRLAAVFAIILGFVGKLGGFLRTIPQAVMGGISIMLFSMIGFIGFRNIRDNHVKLNIKNIIVMAAILFIGFSGGLFKELFGFTIELPITESISLNGLSLAAIVGILLNAILKGVKKDAWYWSFGPRSKKIKAHGFLWRSRRIDWERYTWL